MRLHAPSFSFMKRFQNQLKNNLTLFAVIFFSILSIMLKNLSQRCICKERLAAGRSGAVETALLLITSLAISFRGAPSILVSAIDNIISEFVSRDLLCCWNSDALGRVCQSPDTVLTFSSVSFGLCVCRNRRRYLDFSSRPGICWRKPCGDSS